MFPYRLEISIWKWPKISTKKNHQFANYSIKVLNGFDHFQILWNHWYSKIMDLSSYLLILLFWFTLQSIGLGDYQQKSSTNFLRLKSNNLSKYWLVLLSKMNEYSAKYKRVNEIVSKLVKFETRKGQINTSAWISNCSPSLSLFCSLALLLKVPALLTVSFFYYENKRNFNSQSSQFQCRGRQLYNMHRCWWRCRMSSSLHFKWIFEWFLWRS